MPMRVPHAAIAAALALAAAPAAAQAQSDCAALASLAIPASAIGLPTSGVRITAATPMPAAGTAPKAVGPFCRVTADILPVDPKAPAIKMEVNLPADWNGKALMYGGGGNNGSILSTGGTIRLQPADLPIPLGRGYATFASDSGHQGNSADGSFALNEEALRNYALDAVKKTRDVAGRIIAARYGRPADKVYFHGSSNGGKEAMGMIQRYPADLDGAIVFWPATMLGGLHMQFLRVARAMAEPGAWPSLAKRKLVLDAAIEACDALDGAKDGIIANPRACEARFDPATATLAGKPLRCPTGADEGDTCLSDVQIRFLKVMATPVTLERPLPDGSTTYPGFYVWGTDLGSRTSDPLATGITQQGLGTVAPALPARPDMAFIHIFADQFAKYFVTRDPASGAAAIDPEHPGPWQARLTELATLLSFPSADLASFRQRGGKIIMLHGTADQIIPAAANNAYFERVVATMGREAVASFYRYYELPGVAHSGNGTIFTPTWDALGALDAWVTKGTAPADPIITDIYAHPGRTRPLCEYPSWPKYNGTGDLESAGSFSCATD